MLYLHVSLKSVILQVELFLWITNDIQLSLLLIEHTQLRMCLCQCLLLTNVLRYWKSAKWHRRINSNEHYILFSNNLMQLMELTKLTGNHMFVSLALWNSWQYPNIIINLKLYFKMVQTFVKAQHFKIVNNYFNQ